MKKYYGFILGLLVSIGLLGNLHNKFTIDNEIALQGNYIKDFDQYKVFNAQLEITKYISSPEAKALELKHLETIRKNLVEPAKPLNEIEWLLKVENLFFFSFLTIIDFILAFIWYAQEKYIEKRKKEKHFKNNQLPVNFKKQEHESELLLNENGFNK